MPKKDFEFFLTYLRNEKGLEFKQTKSQIVAAECSEA